MGVSLLRVRNTSRPVWPGWGVLGRQGGRQSQRGEGAVDRTLPAIAGIQAFPSTQWEPLEGFRPRSDMG